MHWRQQNDLRKKAVKRTYDEERKTDRQAYDEQRDWSSIRSADSELKARHAEREQERRDAKLPAPTEQEVEAAERLLAPPLVLVQGMDDEGGFVLIEGAQRPFAGAANAEQLADAAEELMIASWEDPSIGIA